MKRTLRNAILIVAFAGTAAFAENASDDTLGAGEKSQNLPVPKSDHDPAPRVASPGVPEGGVVKQAGVGGDVAYGRAGVVELGGSGGLTNSARQLTITFSPSVGWFFQDNLELSAIFNLNYASVAGVGGTQMALLVEPSYHLPFSQQVFGFLGVGVGLGYETVGGAGFALAPRIGANVMIGRSGVLTPAIFGNYSTVQLAPTSSGANLSVNFAYGLQIGYTVML